MLFSWASSKRERSVLAPDIRHTTVFPLIYSLKFSSAATDMAPDGSDMIPLVYKSIMV